MYGVVCSTFLPDPFEGEMIVEGIAENRNKTVEKKDIYKQTGENSTNSQSVVDCGGHKSSLTR